MGSLEKGVKPSTHVDVLAEEQAYIVPSRINYIKSMLCRFVGELGGI